MIVFTSLVITLSILSTASGTGDLLNLALGVTPDPVVLPNVVPGASLDLSSSDAAAPPKAESLLDKLTAPFAFLQGGLPCLGQTSLKAGNCKDFDECAAKGGFGDGKSLCIGQAVCCVKPVKCGEISLLNNTILANPGFPGATVQTGSCVVKLIKPIGISHIKLLIEDLELAQPDKLTGKCENDALSVSGGVLPGFGINKICGLNSKTHIYIPTVIELSDIFIKIDLADDGSIKRRWLIRAEMIEFKSPEKPPVGCAQYYREEAGLITSLNFDLINKTGLGNIDGLKYGICFGNLHGGCTIKLKPIFFNLGGKISSHTLESAPSRVSRAAPFVYRPNTYSNRPSNNRYFTTSGLHAPSNVPASYLKAYSNAQKFRPQGAYTPYRYRLPVYHRPSLVEAQRYPYSPFLVKLPYGAVSPFMNRPMAFYPNMFTGQYNAPMKKPDVDIAKLEGKLDDKLDDKLDKLQGLGDKLGLNPSAELSLPASCPDQDTVVFPIPDDGTSPIHCGDEFHFGGELVSSFSPFMITVFNKGLHHGKGFAVTYKVQC